MVLWNENHVYQIHSSEIMGSETRLDNGNENFIFTRITSVSWAIQKHVIWIEDRGERVQAYYTCTQLEGLLW